MKRLRDAAREATAAQAAADVAPAGAPASCPIPRAETVRQAADASGSMGETSSRRARGLADGPRHARPRRSWRPRIEKARRARCAPPSTTLRDAAAAEVQRREDAWRPLALADRAPGSPIARDGPRQAPRPSSP